MSTGNPSPIDSFPSNGRNAMRVQHAAEPACFVLYSFLDFASLTLTKMTETTRGPRTVWSAFIAAVSKSQMTVVRSALGWMRWPEQLRTVNETANYTSLPTLLLSRLLTKSLNLCHCAMCLINPRPRAHCATTTFEVAQASSHVLDL